MLVSATPGSTITTTLTLPAPATGQVRWAIRDHTGALVVRGTQAPTGAVVGIAVVLPSGVTIPADGSKYSLTASDGTVSATEYFSVISADAGALSDHAVEVAYMKGTLFTDTLITDREHTSVTVTVLHVNGTELVPSTTVVSPSRRGEAYIYRFTSSAAIDTLTAQSQGTGMVLWTKTDSGQPAQEMHPFYTITPRVADFMNGIRKIVDKARIGDANRYLEYTTSDYIHAVLRGADYVGQSEPLMTPFTLDGIPMPLRDYIIKAGAVDLLRAQYGAEAMSAFDFQGLGVQLNVDRSAALDSMISSLVNDLQGLREMKKKWLEAGKPVNIDGMSGRRPIGALAISTGPFTNQPMVPSPFIMGGSGLYSFQRYGVWR